jgi:hypothetical protein
MDLYSELRQRAQPTRDQAIAAAREQYRRDLRSIEEVMAKLPSGVRKPQKPDAPILARVIEVMSKARPFMAAQLIRLQLPSSSGMTSWCSLR